MPRLLKKHRGLILTLKMDRRSNARLSDGSVRGCQKCGGLSEFREKNWMMQGGRSGPVWLCTNERCGAGEFVRAVGAAPK